MTQEGTTYPDIMFLPQLAALFHTSMDELMGYQPQLTKERISRIYHELADQFTAETADKILEDCDIYVKKYYACFPFLLQMAVFYLNHADLCMQRKEMHERALSLCERIQKDSKDPKLIKSTVTMTAMIHLLQEKPQEAMKLLGEDAPVLEQDGEMIASCYQLLGNTDKTGEVIQICAYQHLLFLLGDLGTSLFLEQADIPRADETIRRMLGIAELFQVENLHFNAGAQMYLNIAFVYAARKETDKALEMVERYTEMCLREKERVFLHGDSYFDRIEGWLGQLPLGKESPRSGKIMKKLFVQPLLQTPYFQSIKEEPRFLKCIEKLNI